MSHTTQHPHPQGSDFCHLGHMLDSWFSSLQYRRALVNPDLSIKKVQSRLEQEPPDVGHEKSPLAQPASRGVWATRYLAAFRGGVGILETTVKGSSFERAKVAFQSTGTHCGRVPNAS
ncbi:Hypothetical predicted protein [Marmota monax]|uniref:Uncharacterized protein n=1 Tax=Marmota monax TaxID=9995 RepID=A0A5E4A435_MARMO|nr:Hypothetical predicted protein [Marmota monax]